MLAALLMAGLAAAGLSPRALAAAAVTATTADNGNDDKITICHVAGRAEDPANYLTLTLPPSAVYGNSNGNGGHFNQDGTPQAGHEHDSFGPCLTSTTTTGTTGTTTTGTTGTTTTGTTGTTHDRDDRHDDDRHDHRHDRDDVDSDDADGDDADPVDAEHVDAH